MGLIGEPAVHRNLRKRCVGLQHEFLRSFNSSAHDIGMRSRVERFAEGPAEIKRAQFHQARESGCVKRRIEVRFDVGGQLAGLPRRKAATRRPGEARCTIAVAGEAGIPRVDAKCCKGAPHALVRLLRSISKSVARGLQESCKRALKPL